MMTNCTECGRGTYEEVILPEHMEDVGGIKVLLRNTVHVRRCRECGDEQTMIPNMIGLVRAVAIQRALIPVRLEAGDIRLMRRALDLTQKEFADAMGIAAETVSRWERVGGQGLGSYSERAVRHNVCALLADEEGFDYDPAVIARMTPVELAPESPKPLIVAECALVIQDGVRSRRWDAELESIAA